MLILRPITKVGAVQPSASIAAFQSLAGAQDFFLRSADLRPSGFGLTADE
jgi:hypothetical protein